MTREEAIERFNGIINAMSISIAQSKFYPSKAELDELCDIAISALQAEPIERISNDTIVVKYADYEDIGRIILTNGDIFCKMFYEDATQNDDSDYDSLVPDEYKTEPSDLISRADALEQMAQAECGLHYDDCEADNCSCSYIQRILDIPSADAIPIEKYHELQHQFVMLGAIFADLTEVVRCKDCIHWKADNEVFELGFCCVFPQKWVAETFYCADGERREE